MKAPLFLVLLAAFIVAADYYVSSSNGNASKYVSHLPPYRSVPIYTQLPMVKQQPTEKKQKVSEFLPAIMMVFGFGGLIAVVYYQIKICSMDRDIEFSRSWEKASGRIIDTCIEEQRTTTGHEMGEDIYYVIKVKYNYFVSGNTYLGGAFAPGLFQLEKNLEEKAKQYLASNNYHKNSEIFVHYDPSDPRVSALKDGNCQELEEQRNTYEQDSQVNFVAGLALIFGGLVLLALLE